MGYVTFSFYSGIFHILFLQWDMSHFVFTVGYVTFCFDDFSLVPLFANISLLKVA